MTSSRTTLTGSTSRCACRRRRDRKFERGGGVFAKQTPPLHRRSPYFSPGGNFRANNPGLNRWEVREKSLKGNHNKEEHMRIRVAHASLQSSDIERIFDRGVARKYAWIMGTEAGPGANNTSDELVRISKEHGYRPWVPSEQSKGSGRSTDCWIAVREDLILGGWKTGFVPVIPGSQQLYKDADLDPDLNPRWGPKGVVTAEFNSLPELGAINLAVAHHLTKGQTKGSKSVIHGVDHWAWNQKLDVAMGKWLGEQARGTALGFGSADRNASDRRNPANVPGTTTMADELKKWQNTGHGDIDWIFSVNKDGRVKAQNFIVLDDKEFPLNTDHFFCEGVFMVEALKPKR